VVADFVGRMSRVCSFYRHGRIITRTVNEHKGEHQADG
jgi:hypothetical protein